MTGSAKRTVAFSVARLTTASTPSSRPSFFSIRAEQEAQVMPVIARSTSWTSWCGRWVVWVISFFRRSRPKDTP